MIEMFLLCQVNNLLDIRLNVKNILMHITNRIAHFVISVAVVAFMETSVVDSFFQHHFFWSATRSEIANLLDKVKTEKKFFRFHQIECLLYHVTRGFSRSGHFCQN